MTDCFAFRFFEPNDDKRKSVVVFFPTRVSLDRVAKALKQDIAENLVPKNVYIMSFGEPSVKVVECKADTAFANEFLSYVGDIDTQLKCLYADTSGNVLDCGGTKVDADLQKAILHHGMVALFRKHQGLITSSHGYHFTKPSGDHCDKFIRASNLLVSSIEVSFLAVSLLPYFRNDLKRIYVDTSSIAYLVSITLRLYGDFIEGTPSIESFESYAVLKQKYDFVEDRSSLLVISATTSGSLAKSLLANTSFSNDQIVTLFHVNLPKGQQGVFDVSSAIPHGIVSRKPAECQFCKRGSKLIRIAGDQFLPENPKHELLVIKKTNFEKPRQKFFSQFAAQAVLSWDTAASSIEESREHFFIDVEAAISLDKKPFSNEIDRNIRRYVSRDLSTVVVFEDSGSQLFAQKLCEYLGESASNIKWLAPNDLNEEELTGSASVIVIAGAITSGRSLLAISRKLRCIDPLATIGYFVAFSKLPNDESFKQLENDLCLGGHQLIVLNHCPLPRIKEHTKTAWDWEREFLMPFCGDDPMGEAKEDLPELLLNRFHLLDGLSKDANQLYLSDPNGQPLKLRRTFAFWADLDFPEERLQKTTQADVYWTVQCVLHDLRNASDEKGLATTYHTTLISPANFDRYNDGVIQASLLRAALPVELDYRVDAVFSRQMTDVILSVIENWNNAQGEGSLEFLLALWTQRLRLNDDHLAEIIKLKNAAMPEAIKFLLDRLQALLGGTA